MYLQVPIYRVPTFPPIQLGAEDISVCAPPIWIDISPVGVHKDNEIGSREIETDGYSSDCIPRWHTDCAPLKGGNIADYSPNLSDIQSPGVVGQHGKTLAYSTAGATVPGVPGQWTLHLAFLTEKMRKVTECLSPYTSTVVVNKRHNKVHGESLSLSKSNLAGSTPLAPYSMWWTHWLQHTNTLQAGWPSAESILILPRKPRWICLGRLAWIKTLRWCSPVASIPDITIKSDSSNTGWGTCQGEIWTGGMLLKKESFKPH